ncbi:filamentation induced by cAMP protein Fic [Pedobacter sp. BAL39]|uniref:DUF4172 domain-containing protein n=1 Tax=Pedobacter sp. BAL39 TaxID=391596 RepID=UPI0001559904|nr:DUF4172 domain-containing protein [Pedobacter sp. BAL39]EDM37212.1 filamentation induced by cAMP protein Fic [Pedobacter sp. BAL39]
MYNWELPDWPEFKYNLAAVEAELYDFAEETGEVSGLLKTLPEYVQQEALSQTMSRAVVLSLSKAIEANKSSYYAALKAAQQSNEITEWIVYFAKLTLAAQREAKGVVNFSLQKVLFFDRYKAQLTERQLKAIRKMLDAGIEGFKGGMTAKKYMNITSASKATATRDLQTLTDAGVLISQGEGRSSRYILNLAYPTI